MTVLSSTSLRMKRSNPERPLRARGAINPGGQFWIAVRRRSRQATSVTALVTMTKTPADNRSVSRYHPDRGNSHWQSRGEIAGGPRQAASHGRRRSMSYPLQRASEEMTTSFSIRACAMINRSNGSSCIPGSLPVSMTCSSWIPRNTAPAARHSSRNRIGSIESLPKRCLIATSQRRLKPYKVWTQEFHGFPPVIADHPTATRA